MAWFEWDHTITYSVEWHLLYFTILFTQFYFLGFNDVILFYKKN
jgi:hypothetical protein